MKTFLGWLFLLTGGLLAAWGAYFCLTGTIRAQLYPLPLTAMTGGLIGVAVLVVGFLWIRD